MVQLFPINAHFNTNIKFECLLEKKSTRIFTFALERVQGTLRSATTGIITKAGSFGASSTAKDNFDESDYLNWLSSKDKNVDNADGADLDQYIQQRTRDAAGAGIVPEQVDDPFLNFETPPSPVRPEPVLLEKKTDGENGFLL